MAGHAAPLRDAPWAGFEEAADAAVTVLHGRLGMDLWLVTRVEGGGQAVVAAYPRDVVPVATVLPWAHSFCRRMASGEGPRVAPVVAAVPAYAGLRVGPAKEVAAYVGVPLVRADASLYGSLCGFATRAQPRALTRSLPLVELVAGLLSTLLAGQEARTP